jgi:hypothetical protein
MMAGKESNQVFFQGSTAIVDAPVSEQNVLVPAVRDRRGDPNHGLWAGTVWGTVTSDHFHLSAPTTSTIQ